MSVMTVLGPVAAEALGNTQCHEHLFLEMSRAPAVAGHDGDLVDVDAMRTELAAYVEAGGQTIVEVTTPDLGRRPELLLELATSTSAHIVMGTGFYREPYYPDWIDRRSVAELAEGLVDEIQNGVGESGIRPGIIGEIGSHRRWVSAREERVFRACARAQALTALPLMTHTPPMAAPAHLQLLREAGADLGRVAVGHADGYLEDDYLNNLLENRCFLSFDLIGTGHYPDQFIADRIVTLVRAGHLDRILLATDICRRQRLRAWGGAGYGYLRDVFLPLLERSGLDRNEIHHLTTINSASFLAGTTSN